MCNHIGSFALFSEDIGPFLMTQEQPEMEALPLASFLSLPSPSLYLLFNARNASALLCPESLQLLLSLHSLYFFFLRSSFCLPALPLHHVEYICTHACIEIKRLVTSAFVSERMYFTHS